MPASSQIFWQMWKSVSFFLYGPRSRMINYISICPDLTGTFWLVLCVSCYDENDKNDDILVRGSVFEFWCAHEWDDVGSSRQNVHTWHLLCWLFSNQLYLCIWEFVFVFFVYLTVQNVHTWRLLLCWLFSYQLVFSLFYSIFFGSSVLWYHVVFLSEICESKTFKLETMSKF